ncbi:MAG: type II toxin-antitoxin system antitoxin SocA domain-containing protein [Jatrophihabitantaceae bacterium]
MATYSAHDVACEIRKRLPDVPVKKLHKLLYYCQGWHAGTTGAPLYSESISAWDMGPVVGQLWYAEKQHGPTQIGQRLDEAALNTIGFVLSRYGALSGLELERLTHSEPPWTDADARRTPHSSQRIEFEALERHFSALPGEEDAQEPELDFQAVSEWLAGAQDGPPDGEFSADTPASLRALLDR